METEEVLKEKAKKISIKDGSAYSIMDGSGLKYITPYALSFGASNKFIGLLTMLPSVIGNFLRLVFNKMYEIKPRKKIVVLWSTIQAIFWFPLLLAGLLYFFFNLSLFYSLILLAFSYSGIIIAGTLVSPAWNSWMQDIVKEERGKYFSKRLRITGFVALVSMLLGGFILDYFKKREMFFGFLILFLTAAIGRFISVYFLRKQYEPEFKFDEKSYFSFYQFIKKMNFNNFGRYTLFVSLINFGVAIASPFFAVYMIKNLNFSYVQFTIITMSSILSTLLFLPFWGRFSDKYGNVFVFRFCAFFISFIPIFWLLSSFTGFKGTSLVVFLFIVETFSGFVWAGFNLSTSNFIYDAVSRQKLALCFTYFSFLTSLGGLFGAILGGTLSSSQNFSIFGLIPILSIFLVSGIIRLIPSVIIGIKLKEVRNVDKPSFYLPSFFNIRKT